MNAQKESVISSINMSLKVIRMYDWLLDLYVLDFFVDNHWEKLPLLWRECFEDINPQDLGKILCGYPTKHMLPLTLLALLNSVKTLSLTRKQCNFKNQPAKDNKADDKANTYKCGLDQMSEKHVFMKHVKLKKSHEINLMADVVSSIALSSNCRAVVDFGSGVGHLVRILAYRDGLHAVGIECQAQLTEEARKFDLELEYRAKKYLSEEAMLNLKRPSHLNIMLSSEAQLKEVTLPDKMENYGLVGLHPCGDLGPLLLKHFVSCDKVKFICIVGCCFMKLTCDDEPRGYPMSMYAKGLDSELSYVSREIACHAIEVYCERLMKGDYNYLKVHTYRAVLERILVDHNPMLKHSGIGSVKHTDTMTFESYCEAAASRLPLCWSRAQWAERARAARADGLLAQWRRVLVVYSLRLALAPLVETVVLLDRMLFVMEHEISCAIYPMFDPKLSPRNHIIVAKKPS